MGRISLLFFLIALLPTQSLAQDYQPLKYICSSVGAAEEVAHTPDLIIGLSPLPSGCVWTPSLPMALIGETIRYINVANNQTARIAIVTLDTQSGYSSGLVELLY